MTLERRDWGMNLSELRPGDTVLIEATVTKVADDGEGAEPLALVSVASKTHAINHPIVVTADQVHSKLGSQAAPETSEWPLGTLERKPIFDG